MFIKLVFSAFNKSLIFMFDRKLVFVNQLVLILFASFLSSCANYEQKDCKLLMETNEIFNATYKLTPEAREGLDAPYIFSENAVQIYVNQLSQNQLFLESTKFQEYVKTFLNDYESTPPQTNERWGINPKITKTINFWKSINLFCGAS